MSKAAQLVFGVVFFAEFLIKPKRDAETSRPDHLSSLQAYVLPLANSFKIYFKIDLITESPLI